MKVVIRGKNGENTEKPAVPGPETALSALMIKSGSEKKDLEYWKKKLIDSLKSDAMSKSIEIERMEKARGYPPGTIREWSGKKYKKLQNGEWMRTYTGTDERGERQAVRNVMKKIQAAGSMEELAEIVSANMQRFKDENGKTLPIVKEFMTAARGTKPGEKKKQESKKEPTKRHISALRQDYQSAIALLKVEKGEKALQAFQNKLKAMGPGGMKVHYAKEKEHMEPYEREALRAAISLYDGRKLESGKAAGGLSGIQQKYNASESVTGDEDEIIVGGDEISGTWKLVEADAPSASHDEKTFTKTEGFPTNPDGSTINDRDYEKDKEAQLAVNAIASEFDGRALSFDNPVVVSKDGVVISGNNRTMSSKIAARKGTDKKYIDRLKKRAKKFGLSEADIGKFKNPRVVFEIDSGDYSTKQFAKFNETTKKTMSPVESAVKVSKTLTDDAVKGIGDRINEFETLGELYADKKAVNDVFNTLEMSGIINQFSRPQYVSGDGVITSAGKEFLETVMVGTVATEGNIRALSKPGNKSLRRKLVRSLAHIVQNKTLGGYSINKELNDAIDLNMQARANKDKFKDIEDFASQSNMFESVDKVSLQLAKKLELPDKDFAEFMSRMNANLTPSATGQVDIFFGGTESKDDILKRVLVKSRIIIDRLRKAKTYPVGTIREWSGKKYKKKADNQWHPVAGRGEAIDLSPPIPAAKFEAALYYEKTNDPAATPETVLKDAPEEVKEKIRATEAKLQNLTQTIKAHRKSGEGAAAVYDNERAAIHQKILDGIFTPERVKAAKPAYGPPTFAMLGGRGGSGKSWFRGNVYDPQKTIVLDADEIKGQLPEYEGWNAFEVHEESSDVLEKAMAIAKSQGLNIVIDATMKTTASAVARASDFKKSGYDIECHYMHCPRQVSAKRAVKRFGGPSGRYVPVGVVLSNTTNEKTFDAIKGLAKTWSFRDSSGGPPPVMVSYKKGGVSMIKAISNESVQEKKRPSAYDEYDFGPVVDEKDYAPDVKAFIGGLSPKKKIVVKK